MMLNTHCYHFRNFNSGQGCCKIFVILSVRRKIMQIKYVLVNNMSVNELVILHFHISYDLALMGTKFRLTIIYLHMEVVAIFSQCHVADNVSCHSSVRADHPDCLESPCSRCSNCQLPGRCDIVAASRPCRRRPRPQYLTWSVSSVSRAAATVTGVDR